MFLVAFNICLDFLLSFALQKGSLERTADEGASCFAGFFSRSFYFPNEVYREADGYFFSRRCLKVMSWQAIGGMALAMSGVALAVRQK